MLPIEVMRKIRRQMAKARAEGLKYRERVLAGAKLLGVEVSENRREERPIALIAPEGMIFPTAHVDRYRQRMHDYRSLYLAKNWKEAMRVMQGLRKPDSREQAIRAKWIPQPYAMLHHKATQKALLKVIP